MVSEMEIWARRCERHLELFPGDFGLAANGAAPDLWWKNVEKQNGRKLHYKGLIVVVLGIGSLEVELVAQLLEESTI